MAFAAERAGDPGGVDGLLAELQLMELSDRPAGQLSVGEGKRLELARVLAFKPVMLLLDEPSAGLSPDSSERVSGVIDRSRRQGAAVIWVEHGTAVSDPASRLLVLEGGQVRFHGSLADWQVEREATSS